MLYLKEILPNPSGNESTEEWIRITNKSEDTISTTGWVISDRSGKEYSLNVLGSMSPGELVEIRRDASGIALNNNGDEVYLKDNAGTVVDSLAYTTAAEDEIIVANRFFAEENMPVGNLEQTPVGLVDTPAPGFVNSLAIGLVLASAAALAAIYLVRNLYE